MRGVLAKPPALLGTGVVVSALFAGSCHRGNANDPTRLVVGIQSEPMGGIVSAEHIVLRVAGVVIGDETIKPPHGSRVGFPQPWEREISAEGKGAAEVDVQVDFLGGGDTPVLVTRRASTHFVPGKKSLLRVQLESRCVVYPPTTRGKGRIPGPLSGPTCEPPMTCILGTCRSDVIPPAGLEPYAPNWPTNAPDLCKPRDGGPATLETGTGKTDYAPLADGQTLQAEAGPQGGHHIWIGARMKNLKQAGSTTKIAGIQPQTGTPIPPSSFVFTYTPGDEGYCKLYGLRYQLDNGGIDYTQFLGKPLDVIVTLSDQSGATATSTAHVQIASTLVNP